MKPRPFSLRQLQYAVSIADTCGFRRAAARHVSQPSLSTQLAQPRDHPAVEALRFRDQALALCAAAGAREAELTATDVNPA